jgi:hypothetical protein
VTAITAAIAFHAVAWRSLHELAIAHADANARLTALHAAKPGELARIPALRRFRPTRYALGEDLRESELRERIASLVFGVRGIAIDPPEYGVEPVPAIELRADGTGPADAIAQLPLWWSADLATARDQLESALPAARKRGLEDVRLVANGLHVPGRDEPVLAAWLDSDHVEGLAIRAHDILRATRYAYGRARFEVPGEPTAVWAIELASGRAMRLAAEAGEYMLDIDHGASFALVACDASRCALGRVVSFE